MSRKGRGLKPHTWSSLIKKPIHFLAFGLGSGLITPASGTWGTLLGLILMLPFWKFLLFHPVIAVFFLWISFDAGVFFCDKTAKEIGIHDFGGIVWDEFFGVWFLMLLMPQNLFLKLGLGYSALVCFILFRIFDVIKPPPIKQIDLKVGGGFGIMVDDLIAAIDALIILWLVQLFS